MRIHREADRLKSPQAEIQPLPGLFNQLKSQQGVSLIEIMVAAGVLGISMVGFSYMFANAHGVANSLGSQRMALARAEQKMETLKRVDFASLTAGTETIIIDNRSASRQWTVSDIDDPLDGVGEVDPDYKLVTVSVSWTGRTGNQQVISLASFIAP